SPYGTWYLPEVFELLSGTFCRGDFTRRRGVHPPMPTNVVNGCHLYSESSGGRGAPVLLVHGSWGDHHSWDAVVPGLASRFRVLTYDRRGHSQSERVATQGSVEEDVADLAALIAANHLGPTHVVG